MSRVDLTEFLDAYLGEADELLASANAQLLAIEPLRRRQESTARQVRELFRALHTIKGLSAMVGVEPIVAIAHRMEGALRSADRAGGTLPPGAVDLLFQGVQAIEQRVAALAAGRPVADAPPALLLAIERIDASQAVSPPADEQPLALDPAIEAKLAPFDREALARGVREGRRAISARFTPSPGLAAAGITITTVRERISTVAEIVKVLPIALPASTTAPAGLAFVVLALTAVPDPVIAATIGVDPSAVTSLAEPLPAAPAELEDLIDEESAIDDDPGTGRNHVRVGVARLDEALEGLSALIVGRATLAREVARLGALDVDVRGLTAILRDQQRQVRTLRAAILGLRMVPVSDVLKRVPLILRGLRKSRDKSVRLEIDSGRSELDKGVAERIFPAIVHLVRNAADHGIETANVREHAGKPREGLIRIECRARGNGQLELRVSDDGRGVDAVQVAARAGAPVPTTDAGLLQLLCRPGLSTRDEVSATSGRGMGMDIVRKSVVEQLGGELLLETRVGHGTTFLLRVPLTISIVDAFMFECGAQRFVVPLSTIDEIVEVDAASVVRPPDRRDVGGAPVGMISRRGEMVPLVRLDTLFGLAPSPGEQTGTRALIVRREGEVLAFAVDRLIGQQEIVVRPLEDPLLLVPGISGATDLGDGRPTLVVDLFALNARVAHTIGPPQETDA